MADVYWAWDMASNTVRVSWCQERGWSRQYAEKLAKHAWRDIDHDTRGILLDRHSYNRAVNPRNDN